MTPRHCSPLRCEAESWRACRMVGRELKRWQPSADDAPLEGLEGPHVGGSGGAWDQFAVNRGKFGVQTTFQVGGNSSLLEESNLTAAALPAAHHWGRGSGPLWRRIMVLACMYMQLMCSALLAAVASQLVRPRPAPSMFNASSFNRGCCGLTPLYRCRPIR